MADPIDEMPFAPQSPTAPAPVQQQAPASGLADSWRSWMSSPQNRAAMIQFGLALSQPISAGQNVGGQIGQAFGEGGEAADRVTAQQMRQEELSSKTGLREAQAGLAESRAATAGARSDTSAARLELEQQKLALLQQYRQWQMQTGELNAKIKLQAALAKLNAANDLAGIPKLTIDDIYNTAPGAGGIEPSSAGGGAVLDQARDAIRRGAPRDAVIERLKKQGVDPSGL